MFDSDKEQVNTFEPCVLELLPSTDSLDDLEAIEKWKEQMVSFTYIIYIMPSELTDCRQVTRQENMFADPCVSRTFAPHPIFF